MKNLVNKYNQLTKALQDHNVPQNIIALSQSVAIALAQEGNGMVNDIYGIYDNNGFYYVKEIID